VRGFVLAAGGQDEVSSPTFVLENIYAVAANGSSGQKRTFSCIAHWDLYRLRGNFPEEEIRECIFDGQTVTLIEWPERCSWLDPLLGLDLGFEFRHKGESPSGSEETDVAEPEERIVSIGGSRADVVDNLVKRMHLQR
jgi:tRNA A37 threonylcarbamoyladenosine biosynthesis protein TsaE